MTLDGTLALTGMVLDVTERNRAFREVQELHDCLRDQSIHDALTGLYNRRYLDEMLDRELLRAGRDKQPISFIMGDLDHFKAVNDHYGHLAGDEVLRLFAGLMKRSARGSDIYSRFGGEEFLMVLPGMTAEGAVQRAEQLRRALEATSVSFKTSQIRVTASFGVSAFPRDGCTSDKLISAADAALYMAKAAGRNRVLVSHAPADREAQSEVRAEQRDCTHDRTAS